MRDDVDVGPESSLHLWINRELDEQLEPGDRERLERALAEDPAARRSQAQLRGLTELIRSDRSEFRAADGFVDQLAARAMAPTRAPVVTAGRRWLEFGRQSALLAAACLVVLGMVYIQGLPDQAMADDTTVPTIPVPDEEVLILLGDPDAGEPQSPLERLLRATDESEPR